MNYKKIAVLMLAIFVVLSYVSIFITATIKLGIWLFGWLAPIAVLLLMLIGLLISLWVNKHYPKIDDEF
jgi:hypothetical protein